MFVELFFSLLILPRLRLLVFNAGQKTYVALMLHGLPRKACKTKKMSWKNEKRRSDTHSVFVSEANGKQRRKMDTMYVHLTREITNKQTNLNCSSWQSVVATVWTLTHLRATQPLGSQL